MSKSTVRRELLVMISKASIENHGKILDRSKCKHVDDIVYTGVDIDSTPIEGLYREVMKKCILQSLKELQDELNNYSC